MEKRVIDALSLRDRISGLIRFSFSRSSGSGGQNVNKVNTKVTAKLVVGECGFLDDAQKTRVRKILATRINSSDEIVIQVQDERSQYANREKAVERFVRLLSGALKEKKKRRKTRPSSGSIERRIKSKKSDGEKKRRRKLNGSDF
jgi:ribosome-associated protein